MYHQQAEQAPQRLIQKRGVHRLHRIIAGGIRVATADNVSRHAPRQSGVAAKGLLVEEVAPAADRLTDQKAGRRQIKHSQGIHLAERTHPQRRHKRHDYAAVNRQSALPDTQNAQRIAEVLCAILRKNDVVQTRSDKGKQRADQHHVRHRILGNLKFIGTPIGIKNCQQKADGNQHAVPANAEFGATDRKRKNLLADVKAPAELRERNVIQDPSSFLL